MVVFLLTGWPHLNWGNLDRTLALFKVSMRSVIHERTGQERCLLYTVSSIMCALWDPGPQFNIKMSSYQFRKSHCEDETVVRSSCLVHPAVRDKRQVSEIDLSQPRHETAFWWRHNGPVTSQLTDPIKWRNYPFELMFKCAYINTHNKESMTQRYRILTNVQLCLIFLYISIWFES